jgi:hypothetical protein
VRGSGREPCGLSPGAAGLLALVTLHLAVPSSGAAQAVAMAGTDRVRLELPATVLVESYSNAGYRLRVEGGHAAVEVSLAPMGSRQPFALPPAPEGAAEPVSVLARAVAAGASSRYQAVSRVLEWVARNVAYDLDRSAPQDALAVLERRSGYCTGVARLSVALLRALSIPARDVPGFLVAPAGGGPPAGFHRWVEVYYDDVGWVFSDPLLALHYVPATYVRLASESLLAEAEAEAAPGRLLWRDDRRLPIDLIAEGSPRLTVRRNDAVRRAGALQITVGGGASGRAVLEGRGSRRIRILDRGESTFVGLEPGSYVLRVEVEGAEPSLKRVILRDRVWGSIHLPRPPAVPTGAARKPNPAISKEEST